MIPTVFDARVCPAVAAAVARAAVESGVARSPKSYEEELQDVKKRMEQKKVPH